MCCGLGGGGGVVRDEQGERAGYGGNPLRNYREQLGPWFPACNVPAAVCSCCCSFQLAVHHRHSMCCQCPCCGPRQDHFSRFCFVFSVGAAHSLLALSPPALTLAHSYSPIPLLDPHPVPRGTNSSAGSPAHSSQPGGKEKEGTRNTGS